MNSTNEDPEWAYETPRPRFKHEYKLLEKVEFLTYFVVGPNTRKYRDLVDFIPRKTTLNDITPKLKLGFVGDIMKMKSRDLNMGPKMKHFFSDIDYFIGNFEGIITNRKNEVVSEQIHGLKILRWLKSVHPPEKTFLTYANNHCNDFGWNEYKKSYQMVKDLGFNVIGRRDEPNDLIDDKVNIAALTAWSDHPCEFIASFNQVQEAYKPEAKFNIFYPHWGYELQMYPHPTQIDYVSKLFKKWDMLVGHHSHNPQPVTAVDTPNGKKLAAYSLGNFTYGVIWKKYHHYGIVLKVEIGPNDDGIWQVGNIEWQFNYLHFRKNKQVDLELNKTCRWFKGI